MTWFKPFRNDLKCTDFLQEDEMLNGHVKPEEQAEEQPVDELPVSTPEQQFANGNEDYGDMKARLMFFRVASPG